MVAIIVALAALGVVVYLFWCLGCFRDARARFRRQRTPTVVTTKPAMPADTSAIDLCAMEEQRESQMQRGSQVQSGAELTATGFIGIDVMPETSQRPPPPPDEPNEIYAADGELYAAGELCAAGQLYAGDEICAGVVEVSTADGENPAAGGEIDAAGGEWGVVSAGGNWFFYTRADEQCGPVTIVELSRMYDAGEIHDATYVWNSETCVEWVALVESGWMYVHDHVHEGHESGDVNFD